MNNNIYFKIILSILAIAILSILIAIFGNYFQVQVDVLQSVKLNVFLKAYFNFAIASIPVISALAYFIYREQKNVSLKFKNFTHLALFICFTFISALLALLLNIFKPDINPFFNLYMLVIQFFFILVSFILLVTFVHVSILNVNYLHQIKKSINGIKKRLDSLYKIHNHNLFEIEYNYNYIHKNIESIFQLLHYLLDNNMDSDFDDKFDSVSSLLLHFWETPNDNTYSEKLFKQNQKKFKYLYNIILKNLTSLLFHLYDAKRIKNFKSTLSIIRNLEPDHNNALYPTYIQALKDVTTHSSDNQSYLFKNNLSFLEKYFPQDINSYNPTKTIGFLLIYQQLLKENLGRNDIEKVTNITYSLQRVITPNNQLFINSKPNRLSSKIKESIYSVLNEQTDISNQLVQEISLFILFQSTLKSIETGSYSVTGQLIKRIVTDYSAREIQNLFPVFWESKGTISSFLNNYPAFNDIIDDFSFDINSYDYCIQKLLILLLGQEFYSAREDISFSKRSINQYSLDFLQYFEKNYINYVVKKISNVGRAYGLLFIIEDDILSKLVEFIKDN